MTVSYRNWLPSVLILGLTVLAFAASPASAAEEGKPWWHLTAEPVSTYLSPTNAPARDEVLEVSVSASSGDVLWWESVNRPAVFPFNVSHEEVQAKLEGLYGAGNAEVTGGPVDTATGSVFGAATFMGNLTVGSPVVVVPEGGDLIGKFGVGQPVKGEHIPTGTTIVEANINGNVGGTLKLSQKAEATAEGVELSGAASSTVEGFTPTSGSGSFAVGQEVVGSGIAPGTKLEAVDLGTHTATLSQSPAYSATPTVISSVTVPYTITIKGRAVPFEEIQQNARSAQYLCYIDLASGCVPPPELVEGSVSVVQKAQGRADGEIFVTASNLGSVAISGESEPVTISDVLPAGFEAVGVQGKAFEGRTNEASLQCSLKGENGVAGPSCSFAGKLPPYASLTMHLSVDLSGPKSGEKQLASVTGGAMRPLSISREIPVGESTPFGISDYELVNESEGGGAETQAGAHPFQQTTTVIMNQTINANGFIEPAALPKDLHFRWPAGLVGNPTSLSRCSLAVFLSHRFCPADSAIGVAKLLLTFNQGGGATTLEEDVPVFSLVPSPGEPARFGFRPNGVPVYIDPSVRSGRDYGITVNTENISQLAGFRSAEVTVWGVPGATSHDQLRGEECLAASQRAESCTPSPIENPSAFLSLPTSCPVDHATGQPEPLVSTVTGDSWLESKPTDEQQQLAEYVMPAMDGCDALPFNPSVVVKPDGHEASKPTGLNVDVHVPQSEALNPTGLAEADPKDITVTLPEGVAVNPSSGDGLQACSEGLVGFTGLGELNGGSEPGVQTATFKPFLPESVAAKTAIEKGDAPAGEASLEPGLNFCSNASKIGEVTIKTPLLPPTQPLKGSVYLATQNQNPFGSLLAMYLVAEDPVSGTLVRIAGQVHLSVAGQIETTFEDSPQAPFEDAELHFFGGERAPLASPAHCGAYTTTASLTPWTGGPPVAASSTFNITEGPNHTSCPGASLPFSPSLQAGSPNVNAGAFSPLDTTISRADGNQNIQQVTLHMAPGMSGILAGVPLCPEAQANEGTCGAGSLIGETTVSAGVGNDPVSVTGGKVYLTEKYAGAPFGLSIVNPVKAGPFDLEHDTSNPAQNPPCDCVVVRAKIEIDPLTAALTITTDASGPHAIPHLIDGIPVQIKAVNVTVNRPNFTFNPTNCNPLSITGAIASDEGASSPVSDPFQVTNCAALKYTPTLTVSTAGKASKANGASLFFKIAYPKGAMSSQSWMKLMKFNIPKQLPSRLTTLQKACIAATFETNRAACPPASIIGHVLVHTPVLPVPLEGPLYFVSYGGAAFPDAVAVIQGDGITIESHGHTFIGGGVTSATFETVPDVPFESIEVTVPQGPFSEFGANLPAKAKGSFCGQKLVMPIRFKAQNGMEITQNTPIGVTGCPPSVSITKIAVKGNSVAVTVNVSQTGTVKITGKGLRSTTKKGLKAGTHTITVPLTATGRAAKRHGRKLKIQAALTVSGRTGTATATLKL